METNEKLVNGIFLSTWANKQFSFTSADSNALSNIATQNPAFYGEAVYKARYMLKHFQPDFLDNNESRLAHNSQQNKTIKNNSIYIHIYPNPTNDNITISFTNVVNGEYLFELFNTIGSKILAKSFTIINSTAIISLDNVTEGVYYCRISDINGNRLLNNKLVIIK